VFEQTFFLATQENGFYVHNDMLRLQPSAPDAVAPVPIAALVAAPAMPAVPAGVVVAAPAPPPQPQERQPVVPSPTAPAPPAEDVYTTTAPPEDEPLLAGLPTHALSPPRAPLTAAPAPLLAATTATVAALPAPATLASTPPVPPSTWAALVKSPNVAQAKAAGVGASPSPAVLDVPPASQPLANGHSSHHHHHHGHHHHAHHHSASSGKGSQGRQAGGGAGDAPAALGKPVGGKREAPMMNGHGPHGAASTSRAVAGADGAGAEAEASTAAPPVGSQHAPPTSSFYVKVTGLPNEHLELGMLDTVFGAYGPLARRGIAQTACTVHNVGGGPRSGGSAKVAYVRYEDAASADAAVAAQASIKVLDHSVVLERVDSVPGRAGDGSGMGGHGGRGGYGGMRLGGGGYGRGRGVMGGGGMHGAGAASHTAASNGDGHASAQQQPMANGGGPMHGSSYHHRGAGLLVVGVWEKARAWESIDGYCHAMPKHVHGLVWFTPR
jgi:hypothetical protein